MYTIFFQESLYVEDNLQNRLLVNKILASSGYTMVEAVDGVEGLKKIKSIKPKLVLLDIDWPRMDGMEVVQHVRADEEIRHIIVVALTASTSEDDKKRFLAAGCDGYLPKPVSVQELRDLIEKWHWGR